MRRLLTILVVLAIIAGGSWVLYSRLGAGAQSAQPGELPEGTQTAEVTRGEIDATISATGHLQPESLQQLAFSGTGRVVEVLVREGDTVTAGQPLARLDASDLELAARQAEAAVAVAEATLERTRTGPSEQEIAAAQSSVAAARAQLNDLAAGPSETDRELARLQLDQARNSLWGAQGSRDALGGNPLADGGSKTQAEAQVANAEVGVRIAELQLQQLDEAAPAGNLAAARNQLAQAEANLARLLATPSQQDIAVAAAQLEQARVSAEAARKQLDNATLTAPFDGVIVAWTLKVGDVATPSLPVGTLADLSRYHIMLSVDETEIGRIEWGQAAMITLDAFPDTPLQGSVTKVDLVGSNQQGIVIYGVRIDLADTELAIRPEMTAAVEVVVDRRGDALLVPTRALRADNQGRYVEAVVDGLITRVNVRTGLSDDTHTEILEGELSEGQQVVINTARDNPFAGASPYGG